jgi:glutamate decarboxylase
MDAHKQLYAPMGAGVVLCRDPRDVKAIQHSAQYIIRKGSHDLGKFSLEGSRPGMSLLLHSALHIMGKEGYEFLIDDGVAKAAKFAELIEAHPAFELIHQPELNIVTYRYMPKDLRKKELGKSDQERISLMQVRLQKKQRSEGKSFVSRTKFFVHRYGLQLNVLRTVLANPLTTEKDLVEILDEQSGYGDGF